jgi:hypothetical protein
VARKHGARPGFGKAPEGRPPLFGSSFAMSREAWLSARTHAHRLDPDVHDDLDLSFALEPDARVTLHDSLQVQISARPLADSLAFVRRMWRGARTVGVNRRRVALARRHGVSG